MKQILFLLFALNFCVGQSQEDLELNQTITYGAQNQNWKHFELSDSIEAQVLSHLPATMLCGNLAFASVTLLQTKDNQMLRVLDLCNTSNYKHRDQVIIAPAQKPKFNVLVPNLTYIDDRTGEPKKTEVDKNILRTTYGDITVLEN